MEGQDVTKLHPVLLIERQLRGAVETQYEGTNVPIVVSTATDPRFGDFQSNVALMLGDAIGSVPRKVAEGLVADMDLGGLCERIEVAGPGFINFSLSGEAISRYTRFAASDRRLGVREVVDPETVVIDYSSPNVAKEMHVGHLRSTVIGDAISRILAYRGHTVVRQNHLGDWGTQFGMLIEHLMDQNDPAAADRLEVEDLDELYRQAKARDDRDSEFSKRARERVVKLQAGDDDTRAVWRELIEESKRHFNQVYRRLGVLLTDEDIRGESFFNSFLEDTVSELEETGLAEESEGAKVVFVDTFTKKGGEPLPPEAMLIQKADGGYLYSTTDLAAIRFRIGTLDATRILYVVDARQARHFKSVFWTARKAGWVPSRVRLEHVPFGMILGPDNKPYKTREGGTVKLASLFDDAHAKAVEVLAERDSSFSESEKEAIAESVGIGALKFADLVNDRRKDYVFDPGRMLAFEGLTAPYIQNAHVRIQSILRKAKEEPSPHDIDVEHVAERALALELSRFGAVLEAIDETLEPHRLCRFLGDVATEFHRFYEQCSVLGADSPERMRSRLALAEFAGRVLAAGLDLLGVVALGRM